MAVVVVLAGHGARRCGTTSGDRSTGHPVTETGEVSRRPKGRWPRSHGVRCRVSPDTRSTRRALHPHARARDGRRARAGAIGLDSVRAPGFRRGVLGDGYDGDAQGSRFWGVRHVPQGEAPFSAPQAKKKSGPKYRFIEF